MTLTLTLDRVILHTVVHHSLTSTYTPNFIDRHLRPALLGRLCQRVDLINAKSDNQFVMAEKLTKRWNETADADSHGDVPALAMSRCQCEDLSPIVQ